MKRLFVILFLLFTTPCMANTLYLKSAGGNWNAASTWSTVSSAGADNSGPPAASSNCIAELGSGNVTINSGSVARSFDTTSGTGSWAGTITHTSGITWTIGDGTDGTGNVALKLNSGVTYSPSSDTMAITFANASSSGTAQKITWAGKKPGNVTFNGTGGKWQIQDQFDTRSSTTTIVTVTSGSFDLNGQTANWGGFNGSSVFTRNIILGAATINVGKAGSSPWTLSTTTGLAFSGASSTITAYGNSADISTGGQTYGTFNITGDFAAILRQSATFAKLSRTGAASNYSGLQLVNNIAVTSQLTLNGNSQSNRLLIYSSTTGTQRTITKTSATVTASNVDLSDIKFSTGTTDLSAISGGSGDFGGNSGITFTAGANQYWVAGTGNISDVANHWASSTGGTPGTGRYPLAQDTAIFDGSSFSTTGQTVTYDTARLGGMDWSLATNSPTFNISMDASLTVKQFYGSIVLVSGMTITQSNSIAVIGRNGTTLTSAGVVWGSAGESSADFYVNTIGSTFTLNDAFNTGADLIVQYGTFNANNFNVTAGGFKSGFTTTRTVTGGTGMWTLSKVQGFSMSPATNLTATLTSTPILLSYTGPSEVFFAFPTGSTLFTLSNTASPTNNTQMAITHSSGGTSLTIPNLNLYGKSTVTFDSAYTYNITNFNANGTSGNNLTINSGSPGSATTLSKTSGLACSDYLTVQDITATGGAQWYAGNHSTNVSGNSGWNFVSCANRSRFMSFLPQ